METWMQDEFVHGEDISGKTMADWLNTLCETYNILEVIPCPTGAGHGTVLLARCYPLDYETTRMIDVLAEKASA